MDEIIEARQQEIFEFLCEEIERSGYGHLLAAGLIFTGGGALLRNVDQLGEEVLGLPVRLGVATDVVAVEPVQDPRFSTSVGLLRFATETPAEFGAPTLDAGPQRSGIMERVVRLFSFL